MSPRGLINKQTSSKEVRVLLAFQYSDHYTLYSIGLTILAVAVLYGVGWFIDDVFGW